MKIATLLMPATLPVTVTPSDCVTNIFVAAALHVLTALHGDHTLFVTVLPVMLDFQRFVDGHLFHVGAFAHANECAGRCGVHGILNVRETRVRALHLIVVNHQPHLAGAHQRARKGQHEKAHTTT